MYLKACLLMMAALFALACSSDKKKAAMAPAGGTDNLTTSGKPSAGSDEKRGDDPSKSQIKISDEIKKACGIADSDAHFDFDSANLRAKDSRVLGQLATCFTSGPLRGREMRLVGHADPRGEPEYNMVLGGKRADNVKDFIVKKGVSSAKVATTSRGEMDSTGTSEETWSRDRRVDVMLGE